MIMMFGFKVFDGGDMGIGVCGAGLITADNSWTAG
jgi:hypothetical protein